MYLKERVSSDKYLGFCILSKVEKHSHNMSGLTVKIKEDTTSVINKVKGLEEKVTKSEERTRDLINMKMAESEERINKKMDEILELVKNNMSVFKDVSENDDENSEDKKEWASQLKMNLFKQNNNNSTSICLSL